MNIREAFEDLVSHGGSHVEMTMNYAVEVMNYVKATEADLAKVKGQLVGAVAALEEVRKMARQHGKWLEKQGWLPAPAIHIAKVADNIIPSLAAAPGKETVNADTR